MRCPSRPSAGPWGIANFQPLEAAFDVLFDVIARAIGRNSWLGGTAEEFVNRKSGGLANEIPNRKIHSADGIHGDAHASVRHCGSPENVPNALNVEGIFVHDELGEML